MARVYLGPEGSETRLPDLTFLGSPPSWPVSTKKVAEKVQMSDGSFRWAFFGTKKVFQIEYSYLTSAELTIQKDLNELNQILRFRNSNEENVWYEVVMTGFSHEPSRMDIRQLQRYKTSFALEQI